MKKNESGGHRCAISFISDGALVEGKDGNEVKENVECSYDPFCCKGRHVPAGECAENTFYPVVQDDLLGTTCETV